MSPAKKKSRLVEHSRCLKRGYQGAQKKLNRSLSLINEDLIFSAATQRATF
jgi:hypothetical protein